MLRKLEEIKKIYIALDIGPIGQLLEPMGTLSFERAYEIFKRQIVQGVKSGADLIIIETMTDLYEAKAALLAAKENSDFLYYVQCPLRKMEEPLLDVLLKVWQWY